MGHIVRAAFPVGVLALAYSVISPHPLLDAGPTLIGVAIFSFVTGVAIFTAPTKVRARPGHKVACLLPWIFTAMLVMNAGMDKSTEVRHSTVVLETHYSRGWDYLVVRSWRPGRKREVLYLKTWFVFPAHWEAFRPGQTVKVGTRSGALHLAWISSLSR